jgi:hypothetical protein
MLHFGDRLSKLSAFLCVEKVFNRNKGAFLAKIAIDNFQIIYEPKGVFNRATLIKIIDSIAIEP